MCLALLVIASWCATPAADALGGKSPSALQQREPEFLPVARAFALTTRLERGVLVARWAMPDGYYLYRARMGFAADPGDALRIGAAQLPAGIHHNDEVFGDMEVYYHEVEARVPYAPAAAVAGGAGAGIKIKYQGCADAGLCYPPQTVRIPVPSVTGDAPPAKPVVLATDPADAFGRLPGGGTASAAVAGEGSALAVARTEAVPASEESHLAGLLARGSVLTALGLFFVAGIGLAFTPCVLPMVPILSSIIVGQGGGVSRSRALALSLAYVLGMAVTYAALGTLVGMFGGRLNLQAAFQAPVVLWFSAAVFGVLALAMFGFYELQLPTAWLDRLNALSQRQRGGQLGGVAIMGALSALVVSPCVSAPLVGALIYLSSTGDALLGGAALLALGLGMGLPLLIVGVGGAQLLPRAGAWMDSVKAVFGVLLLGVAIWLVERTVPGPVALLLWGALCIGVGVHLGGIDFAGGRTGGRKAAQALGVLSVVWGVLLTVGAASGGTDPLAPLRAMGGQPRVGEAGSAPAQFALVVGMPGLQAQLIAATRAGEPVLLDLYADWCISCKLMERDVFPHTTVVAALKGVRLLRADVTANSAADKALLAHFGLFGPPSLLFFDRRGEERRDFRIQGERDAPALAAHVLRFLARLPSRIARPPEA